MATLLKQLEFIFGSRDNKTELSFENHSITLTVKNAQNKDLVQKIASKMGIASTFDFGQVHFHVATPLKEEDIMIPQTGLQKSLHRLLDGDGDVIGLRELLTFFCYGVKYSGSNIYHSLSAIEKSYIIASGWDLDLSSSLGQVDGKIISGKQESRVQWIDNPLLREFIDLLLTENVEQFVYKVGQSRTVLMCGYGSKYYHTESMEDATYPHGLYKRGEYGRSFSDLVELFLRNTITFPNGEQIELSKVNVENKFSPLVFTITPPSIESRWQILMGHVAIGKAIPVLHKRGLLQTYINVDECVCDPHPVTLRHSDLQLVRDALSSYMEGGVYQGFKHAIVGDTLQVWLTKEAHNTSKYSQVKLRKTRKAFEMAIQELASEIYSSYENKIYLK